MERRRVGDNFLIFAIGDSEPEPSNDRRRKAEGDESDRAVCLSAKSTSFFGFDCSVSEYVAIVVDAVVVVDLL